MFGNLFGTISLNKLDSIKIKVNTKENFVEKFIFTKKEKEKKRFSVNENDF